MATPFGKKYIKCCQVTEIYQSRLMTLAVYTPTPFKISRYVTATEFSFQIENLRYQLSKFCYLHLLNIIIRENHPR